MPQSRTLAACLATVSILVPLAHSVRGQERLTLKDSETVPSPGAAMVVFDREAGRFVVTLSRDQDQAYTHRIETGGDLTLVRAAPTGDGPLALTRVGDFIVVANSLSNDLSVMVFEPIPVPTHH
jgi:hypothetical protein